jgi:adenylate cyclase
VSDAPRLSAAELARRAAVPVEGIDRLGAAGILVPAPDGSFRPSDVQRIRLVDAFERAGVSVESLARAIAAGLRSLEGFDLSFPEPPGSSGTTLAALCAELDCDEEVAATTIVALGLPVPGSDDELREDDAEALTAILVLCDLRRLGLDENVAPRFARIYGEAARRTAEAAVRFWDDHVETRVAAADPSGELDALRASVRAELLPGLESTLLWINRRHLEHETLSVIVENTERALERSGLAEPRRQDPPAIAFLDLTGFTSLTEERGDEAAHELASALRELVDEVAARRGGKTVKHLGDGVMFHFARPRDAVHAALELVERAGRAKLPPARVGIDSGRVVYRDGDYYGRTVNLAARITDQAGPADVLVSDATAIAVGDDPALELEPLGPVELRGLRDTVRLHRARRL